MCPHTGRFLTGFKSAKRKAQSQSPPTATLRSLCIFDIKGRRYSHNNGSARTMVRPRYFSLALRRISVRLTAHFHRMHAMSSRNCASMTHTS